MNALDETLAPPVAALCVGNVDFIPTARHNFINILVMVYTSGSSNELTCK